ncbi:MAG TPA: hypothetical protein IAB35_02040 [Candidatus Faecimonas gallistercoris]|nr:hypothetical protein [Candidatus Faecimonas gallistercoris]
MEGDDQGELSLLNSFVLHNDTSIHGDDSNNTTYELGRDDIIQNSSFNYFTGGMSDEEIKASQEKINVKK